MKTAIRKSLIWRVSDGYKADVRYAAGKYKNLFAVHCFDNTVFPDLESAVRALQHIGVNFFEFDDNCFPNNEG